MIVALRWIGLTLVFVGGMIAGYNMDRKPAPPAMVHAPAGTAHATASITAVPATQADGVLYTLALRTSCAPTRPGVMPYSELEGCILAYLNALQSGDTIPIPRPRLPMSDALQSPAYNREGQTPDVKAQPYSLHPGRTPLLDPTDAAYYRQLLKEGRFPTSGSAPGRPPQGAQP
jgi:hypothetical protein